MWRHLLDFIQSRGRTGRYFNTMMLLADEILEISDYANEFSNYSMYTRTDKLRGILFHFFSIIITRT